MLSAGNGTTTVALLTTFPAANLVRATTAGQGDGGSKARSVWQQLGQCPKPRGGNGERRGAFLFLLAASQFSIYSAGAAPRKVTSVPPHIRYTTPQNNTQCRLGVAQGFPAKSVSRRAKDLSLYR